MAESDKLALVSNIAASYLRRNSVSIDQIETVVASVTRAVEQASKEITGGPVQEAQSVRSEGKAYLLFRSRSPSNANTSSVSRTAFTRAR